MALSNSILAYNDCKDFLEAALDDEQGARIPFATENEAEYFRMRCNNFRGLDRKQNQRIHEPGTKMYGVSDYDELVFTIKFSSDGFHWVYANKLKLAPGIVEKLSELNDPDPEPIL